VHWPISQSAAANVIGGNLITVGTVNGATLNITGNAVVGGDLTVDGNVIYINITDLNVQDPIIGLGRGANNTPLTVNDNKDRGEQMWYYTTAENSAFIGYQNSTGNLIAASNVSIANEIVTVNSYGTFVVGALAAASVTSTATIAAGNVTTAGLISAAGNVTGGNVRTVGQVSATGNITGELQV